LDFVLTARSTIAKYCPIESEDESHGYEEEDVSDLKLNPQKQTVVQMIVDVFVISQRTKTSLGMQVCGKRKRTTVCGLLGLLGLKQRRLNAMMGLVGVLPRKPRQSAVSQ